MVNGELINGERVMHFAQRRQVMSNELLLAKTATLNVDNTNILNIHFEIVFSLFLITSKGKLKRFLLATNTFVKLSRADLLLQCSMFPPLSFYWFRLH